METTRRERTPAEKKLDEKILKRVKKGLKWLEETHGPGWEEKIDMETLDLASGANCVLGQVYDKEGREIGNDGFSFAQGYLDLGDERSDELGFSIDNESWEELQETWERVLTPLVSSHKNPRAKDRS